MMVVVVVVTMRARQFQREVSVFLYQALILPRFYSATEKKTSKRVEEMLIVARLTKKYRRQSSDTAVHI